MKAQEILDRYINLCAKNLEKTLKVRTLLQKKGLSEPFLFDTFCLGYSGGSLIELVQGNEQLAALCENLRLLNNGKETLAGYVTIPILDGQKEVVNIAGYNVHPQSKRKIKVLNEEGIFNQAFLRNAEELILTESPLDALLLIKNDIPNTTFLFGDDQKGSITRFLQLSFSVSQIARNRPFEQADWQILL